MFVSSNNIHLFVNFCENFEITQYVVSLPFDITISLEFSKTVEDKLNNISKLLWGNNLQQ